MNDFLSYVSGWLWDYYLLSTALLVVVLLGARAIRQPARRIACHWATAIGLVLLALLSALPGWSKLHMTSPPTPEVIAWTDHLEPATGPEIQIADMPADFQPFTPPIEPMATEPAEIEPTVASSTTVVDYGIRATYAIGVGSLISLIWLAIGAWQVRRLRYHATAAPAQIDQMLDELTKRGSTRPAIGLSARLSVAVAVGLRRPMVLLPSHVAESSGPHDLRAVLAHELAHVRNRDLWLLALVRCLMPILWIHPLFWLWRRGLRLDQETLADAAASELTSQADYADQLVTWARTAAGIQTPRFASSVGLWESPSQLKRRVAILLDEKLTVLRDCSRKWRVGSIVTLLVLAAGLSLVTLQPESAAVEELASDVAPAAQEQPAARDKVEVVAIGTHDEEPQRWWNAAGKPIDIGTLKWKKGSSTVTGPHKRWRRVIIRVPDVPADSSLRWSVRGARASAGGVVLQDGVQSSPELHTKYFNVDDQLNTFDVRVGLSNENWKTIVKHESFSWNAMNVGDGKNVVFAPVVETESGISLYASHNYFEEQFRIVAYDKSGSRHDSVSRGGASAGGVYQTKASFPGLKVSDTKQFEFQIRDYEWVEVNDLPLQSTDVRVELPKTAVTSNYQATISKTVAIDAAEVANLQELVDSHQTMYSKIEALNKAGSPGGELASLLLAKYHLVVAKATLLEAKQQPSATIQKYQEAVAIANQYVPAIEKSYDAGRVVLESVLQAQKLRAEARQNLLRAQRRLAEQNQSRSDVPVQPQSGRAHASLVGGNGSLLPDPLAMLTPPSILDMQTEQPEFDLEHSRVSVRLANELGQPRPLDAAAATPSTQRPQWDSLDLRKQWAAGNQLPLDAPKPSESMFAMQTESDPAFALVPAVDQRVYAVSGGLAAKKPEVQQRPAAVWTPPEDPDPIAIRKEAADDVRAGRYEVALAKRVWYHENALAIQPSQSGVRLSFALSEWLELGESYPPALARMKQMRDAVEKKIRRQDQVRVKFADFQEFASFNETLREEERTLEAFRWLDESDPDDAKRIFRLARKALIAQKQYELYGKYIDPPEDIRRLVRSYRELLKFAEKSKRGELLASHSKNTFARDSATLVAILTKLARPAEAQETADKAREAVQDDQETLDRLNDLLAKAVEGKFP